MANYLDLSNVTLSPESVSAASELILREVVTETSLSDYVTIYQGITNKRRIAFSTPNIIGGEEVGACGVPASGSPISAVELEWDPKTVGNRYSICSFDIGSDADKFLGDRSGLGPGQTQEENILLNYVRVQILKEISSQLIIKAFLGNKNAASNQYTTGCNLGYINHLDGFIAQASTIPSGQKISITENTATTTAGQALNPTAAYEYVRRLYYDSMPIPLSAAQSKVLYCTKSIYYGLKQYMRSTNALDKYGISMSGSELYFEDALIKRVSTADYYTTVWKKYQTSPQVLYNTPHWAILTVIDNLGVSLGDPQNTSTLRSFYKPDEYRHYFDYSYMVDAKILDNNMVSIAV